MSQATAERRAEPAKGPATPYRVMLVDDSAIVRGLYARWIDTQPDIEIVARCGNGLQALRRIRDCRAEVVILDVDMPEMDGLATLPKLLQVAPGVRVLMASTLTQANSQMSLKALELGAADCLHKPHSGERFAPTDAFQADLMARIRALGRDYRAKTGARGPNWKIDRRVEPRPASSAGDTVVLRKVNPVRPDVIAIGASTGGPQALAQVLKDIMGKVQPPILITQHMPKTFTAILSQHLEKVSGMACGEGVDGEPVTPGRVYLAPGGRHMVVDASSGAKVIRLTDDAPENFCRPAVDPLFRSVARAYGARALGVVLTGMGQDGAVGGLAIAEAGGNVLVQDKETSVVWGMPGATAWAGAAAQILPLSDIGARVSAYCRGEFA